MAAETPDAWYVRLAAPFLQADLPDHALKVFLALEYRARLNCWTFASNEDLAGLTGRPVRAVKRDLAALSDGDDPWVAKVTVKGDERWRLGLLLLRRATEAAPAADTPARVHDAVLSLCEHHGVDPDRADVPRRLRRDKIDPSPHDRRVKIDPSEGSKLTLREGSKLTLELNTGELNTGNKIHSPRTHARGNPEPTGPPALWTTFPEGDSWDVWPGPHDPPEAEVRETFALASALFPGTRIPLEYFERQRFHGTRAWRDALRESKRLRPALDSIAYVEKVAASNPDGITRPGPSAGSPSRPQAPANHPPKISDDPDHAARVAAYRREERESRDRPAPAAAGNAGRGLERLVRRPRPKPPEA